MNVCIICEASVSKCKTGKISQKLDVHHISYIPVITVYLCKRCHSMLHTLDRSGLGIMSIIEIAFLLGKQPRDIEKAKELLRKLPRGELAELSEFVEEIRARKEENN